MKILLSNEEIKQCIRIVHEQKFTVRDVALRLDPDAPLEEIEAVLDIDIDSGVKEESNADKGSAGGPAQG